MRTELGGLAEALAACRYGDRERERAHWLALSRVPGMRPEAAFRLVASRGSACAAWAHGGPELPDHLAWNLARARETLDPMALLRFAEREGVRLLAPGDPGFPSALLELREPSLLLRARGVVHPRPGDRVVAVLSPAGATPYGVTAAYRLCRGLAAAGVVVAAGLAAGLASSAHLGGLEGGGPTVAVLPCGHRAGYAPEYDPLRERIEANGVVLSEHSPEARPEPWRFAARDRLLVGLAAAVLVVEAAATDSALEPARRALAMGRTVLAVPGPVEAPQSAGTLQLVREGARLVRDVHDILEELADSSERPPASHPSPVARRVMAAVPPGGAPASRIAEQAGLPLPVARSWLVRLEIEHRLRRLPGGSYAPARR